jgi:hypothetical protein
MPTEKLTGQKAGKGTRLPKIAKFGNCQDLKTCEDIRESIEVPETG